MISQLLNLIMFIKSIPYTAQVEKKSGWDQLKVRVSP
jgi:hypothetical protein